MLPQMTEQQQATFNIYYPSTQRDELLGVLLAAIGIHPFVTFWPGSLPRAEEVHLDWRVLLFAIVVFPHGAWLQTGYELIVSGFNEAVALAGGMKPAAWLLAALVFSHLGLFLLVVLASGWPGQWYRRFWSGEKPSIC